MVKSTTLSTFQAAMQAERETDEQERHFLTFENMHAAIREGCSATTPLGEIVGRVRAMAAEQAIQVSERDIRTVAERIQVQLQQSAPNPLADLAERMVRERGDSVPEVGDPFDGMDVTAEVGDAFGLVQGRIRQWVEDHQRWATEEEIRHKTDELLANAEQPRPASEATYTVSPDGTVSDFKRRPAESKAPEGQEPLPEMPSAKLYAPGDGDFDDGADYLVSGRLAQRAKVLMSRHPEYFNHLHRLSVVYLWRREGGKSKGRAVFGKCSKASGLVKHFSESQFVIWLAADHCRMARYGDREIEALLFHEMLHTAVAEVNENTGRGGGPTLVPHDLEVFRAEIEVYGLWAADLRDVAPAFQQASMFDAEARAIDEELDREEASRAGYAEDPATGDRLPSEGLICHPDGTPMTPEEIADLEAADYRDDAYDEDDVDEAAQ